MAAAMGKEGFRKMIEGLNEIPSLLGMESFNVDESVYPLYKGSGYGRGPTAEEAAAIAVAMTNWQTLPKTDVGQPIIMERVGESGKLQRLVSCGNHHDPRDDEFEMYQIYDFHTPRNVQLAQTRQWLDKMVHADPLHNETYTSQQLKDMKLVGLYLWVDAPESEDVQPTVTVG